MGAKAERRAKAGIVLRHAPERSRPPRAAGVLLRAARPAAEDAARRRFAMSGGAAVVTRKGGARPGGLASVACAAVVLGLQTGPVVGAKSRRGPPSNAWPPAPLCAFSSIRQRLWFERDFGLAPPSRQAADGIVKLQSLVVASSREMDGAAIAINEQRFAPNLVTVVGAAEFGLVPDGDVGEFLKLLPGITMSCRGGTPGKSPSMASPLPTSPSPSPV